MWLNDCILSCCGHPVEKREGIQISHLAPTVSCWVTLWGKLALHEFAYRELTPCMHFSGVRRCLILGGPNFFGDIYMYYVMRAHACFFFFLRV